MFDFMHDPNTAASHLPWIHASIQTMESMRPGDPISCSIAAIQTSLRKINPTYQWSPLFTTGSSSQGQYTGSSIASQTFDHAGNLGEASTRHDLPIWNSSYPDVPDLDHSAGSSEDTPDFTQSGLGWDFDFSTMDLEAFFSVDQFPDATSTLAPGI